MDVGPVAGAQAGAAEEPGAAGVAVLGLGAAAAQAAHLTVRAVHHLYELPHPVKGNGHVTRFGRSVID